jgi:hypothetical protein
MNMLEMFLDSSYGIFLSVVVIVTYFIVVFRFMTFSRERRKREKERFFKAIDSAFDLTAIEAFDDVVNLYKGVKGLGSEDLAYRAGLSKWLREYIVRLVENGVINKEAIINLQSRKETISSFIATNDQSSPYADLPDLERSIISDISAYIEAKNFDAIHRKLGELGGAIQAREDSLSRIRGLNRWSVPLAVIGLVLTVSFGLIALVS